MVGKIGVPGLGIDVDAFGDEITSFSGIKVGSFGALEVGVGAFEVGVGAFEVGAFDTGAFEALGALLVPLSILGLFDRG